MDSATTRNVDPDEVRKFDQQAGDWWNPDGAFRPLHDLNPVRLEYVDRYAPLTGAEVLDVGCGGGILSFAMAERGARVLGVDASAAGVEAAEAHVAGRDLALQFRVATVEDLAAEDDRYDVVTCMEMLEHVPDPAAVVRACATCLKPGGRLVASTLNRTLKAFALGIVAAEHVLELLPKGTHRYESFIRPSELARWGRAAGLSTLDVSGIAYDPLRRKASLTPDVSVNYIMALGSPQ